MKADTPCPKCDCLEIKVLGDEDYDAQVQCLSCGHRGQPDDWEMIWGLKRDREEDYRTKFCAGCHLFQKLLPCRPPVSCRRIDALAKCIQEISKEFPSE